MTSALRFRDAVWIALCCCAFSCANALDWLLTTRLAWRLGKKWPWLRKKTLRVLDENPERFVKKISPSGASFRRRRGL